MSRRTSLDAILVPTSVYVTGWVASPNEVESPVTSARAALIKWYVFGRGTARGFDEAIATGVLGEAVLLTSENRIVRVPTRHLQVYVAAANAEAHLIIEPLPRALAHLLGNEQVVERIRLGELHYREHLLQKGDRVRLRAVVAPHVQRGPYRTTADDQLMVVDEMEHPVLSIDVPEFA
jgi:hypothetical protein